MRELESLTAATEESLGPAGEAEWQRLRQQLDLAGGFWLGFVFSPSPASAATLRHRAQNLLRLRGRAVVVFSPPSPEGLRSVLAQLFEPACAEAGCVWVEAIRSDPPGSPGPWTVAWDHLLLRLNERREALRRHLHGGLVLAATPECKARARDAAPDLWSVRALVVELQPLPRPATDGRAERSLTPDWSERTAPDVALALEEANRRLRRSGEPTSAARALLRAVEGLLAHGQISQAVQVARQAVELLERASPVELAEGLYWLSQAEESEGDLAAAIDHIGRAIHLRRGETDATLLPYLEAAGRFALTQANLGAAAVHYGAALDLARRLVATLGETPERLRDLSISLNKVGDVRREAGDTAGARAAYEESLAHLRQRIKAYGPTQQALRDLRRTLRRVAELREATGDLAAADAAEDELAGLPEA